MTPMRMVAKNAIRNLSAWIFVDFIVSRKIRMLSIEMMIMESVCIFRSDMDRSYHFLQNSRRAIYFRIGNEGKGYFS